MAEEASGQVDTNTAGDQATGAEGEVDTTLANGDQAAADAAAATGDDKAGEGEDGKKSGKPDDAPELPETYEFKMPDGMEMDAAFAESVTPIFKDLGITQEQADKLIGAYADRQQAQAQASQDAFQKQLDDWATELKSDPDFGGDAFDKNAGIAASAIEKFGSQELKEMLDQTGVGSNPEMFKFALAVGKFLVEDQPGSGDAATGNLPMETRMYPNEAKKLA